MPSKYYEQRMNALRERIRELEEENARLRAELEEMVVPMPNVEREMS